MLSLSEQRDAAEQRLLITRARAMSAYSRVEQGLCSTLSALAKTPIHTASVIFFRIGAHPRNLILDELMRHEYGDEFGTYWDSIMSLVRGLDGIRNQIVHWHTHIILTQDFATMGLSRPATWFSDDGTVTLTSTSELSIEDMEEFIAKCDFVGRSLNMFSMFLMEKLKEYPDVFSTWLEIFQQPATYPLPDNHPLSPKDEAP